MARWNPVHVSDQPDEAVYINGRLMQGVNWTLGDEDHDKIRQGYKCIQCMEDWSAGDVGAFPAECPLCAFPVKDYQLFEYNYSFQGHKHLGGQIDPDAELDRLERQRYEREVREGQRERLWVPGSARHS